MKSKISMTALAAALALSGALAAQVDDLPGASSNSMMRQRHTGPVLDRSALRESVDEAQALYDAFARESRGLTAAQTDPAFKSLKEEYHLGGYVGKARKALAQAEEVLELQEAVKLQQKQLKAAAAAEQDAEESKLLGLQSDLVGIVEDLRDTLRTMLSNADEDQARDLKNWLMISEGLLRARREAAVVDGSAAAVAASVSESAEAPLSYDGVTPSADSAVPMTSTPLPNPKAKP